MPRGSKDTEGVVSISSGDRYGAPGVPLRALFRFEAAVCDGDALCDPRACEHAPVKVGWS